MASDKTLDSVHSTELQVSAANVRARTSIATPLLAASQAHHRGMNEPCHPATEMTRELLPHADEAHKPSTAAAINSRAL